MSRITLPCCVKAKSGGSIASLDRKVEEVVEHEDDDEDHEAHKIEFHAVKICRLASGAFDGTPLKCTCAVMLILARQLD